MEDYECDHENIVDGVCEDCGLMMDDDIIDETINITHEDANNNGRPVKKEAFSYITELAKLEIDPEVCKHVCEQISRLKTRTHVRLATHRKNLFGMIYMAYAEKGLLFNPYQIGKRLEMTPKAVRDSVKMISVGIDDHSDRNPVCILSPFNFVRELSKFNDVNHKIPEENFDQLEKFINLIMCHNKMLSNEDPTGIAVAVLKMYYEHNNIPFTEFIKKTCRTSGYIKSKENSIILTLNRIEKTSS